jgi:NADH-quinone oxidoreductase subunit J
MELVAFVVLTALAIVSGLMVILHRNQVIAALSLAGNLVAIAGFYLLLNAQFLALLQVIVYAGAIMVLILFVIMLLNLPEEARKRGTGRVQGGLAIVLAAAFALILGWALIQATDGEAYPAASDTFGTVSSVGQMLFTNFFYAFEAISLLLVVAMIGAVLLAKRSVEP